MLMFRPLIRFADFKGRARRAEYWLFVTFQSVVVGFCLGLAGRSLVDPDTGRALGGFMMWISLAGLAALIFLIPYFAVLARRLHDTGRSAWWMLLLAPGYLSPMLMSGALAGSIGQMGAPGADQTTAGAALLSALAGAGMILLLASLCNFILFIMTLLPGARGPNRFGPDPRDPNAAGQAASIYDEDRLDALFAEARRENGQGPEPAHGARAGGGGDAYKPVFDFGPGLQAAQPAPANRAVDWGRPAYDPGVAPSRPFGRRG